MKRAMLILATLGILCVAAGQVQAHNFHHGHVGHHGGYYGGYYGGHYGPVIVRPPILMAPPIVYPPVYRYRYYDPGPYSGFYYRGRGLSIGVGF